jgi:pimeloyl-ACP methyl ester carboxylesterase
MHIFHFGLRDRKLLGLYFPPGGQKRPPAAVVIANPWGWESIRAHRTIRLLASNLQKEGFGVLRFDYYGTGDSFGDDANVDMEGMTEDLEWAVEEALALAGKDRAIVIGLRLGAFVAGQVAMQLPRQVSKVVFWEPLLTGAELIEEWTHSSSAPQEDIDVRGFLLPRGLGQAVHGLNLLDYAELGSKAVLAQSTGEDDRPWEGIPEDWTVLRVPGPQTWKDEHDLGAGAAPVDLLREIVGCLP